MKITTEMPHTNMARVDSMKGAPRMAPMPISSPATCPPRQDGDERDDRLRQGGAHRRQHAAHGALAQIELAPEPLDAVDEQLAAGKDHGEGDYEEEDGHRPAILSEAGADSPNRCRPHGSPQAQPQDGAEDQHGHHDEADAREKPLPAPGEGDAERHHPGERAWPGARADPAG